MVAAFGYSTLTPLCTRELSSSPTRRVPKCTAEPLQRVSVRRLSDDAKLPQNATPEELKERTQELQKNQTLYKYASPPTIPGIPFIDSTLEDLELEQPSRVWQLKVAAVELNVTLNFAAFDVQSALAAVEEVKDGLLGGRKPWRETRVYNGCHDMSLLLEEKTDEIVTSTVTTRTLRTDFEENSDFLEPYRALFKTIDYPEIADVFMEDAVFARMRVAGFNPTMLSAVMSLEKMPFQITDDSMPSGDTVAKAIAESRLYALDFSFLAGLKQKVNSKKKFAVANALFVVPKDSTRGDLMPIAIEVNGKVVLPPKDGNKFPAQWVIAKLAINSCDALHHQLISHLARTHLLVEPFIAATMRQLASTHPLYMLLRPHFEGTAFINYRAASELTVEGGPVDRIMAGDLKTAMSFVGDFVQNMKFNSGMPDIDMKERGLINDVLNMPYRDDALAHWEAMNEWVYDYLRCFYNSDEDLEKDHELQAWIEELIDPNRGQVKEFGNNGDGIVRDVQYLARAVSNVIFASSVQHAAVNYPQGQEMLYAPAIPGFLWGDPSVSDEHSSINCWRNIVIPIRNAIEQISIFAVLGSVYHTQLGEYERGALPNNWQVWKALAAYKRRLRDIDRRIAKRERSEKLKYEYLRPRNVPQSTNI